MSSIDRIHRLLRLIELLQSGRVYNSNVLAEICGVSRRTIFRDLNTLADSGIRIVFDEGRQGYVLPATTFLPPIDFSLDESLSLLVICHELGDSERGIPFYRSAKTAAIKLSSNLPAHLREYIGELADLITVRLDAHNPMADAQPIYDEITAALTQRHQIRIRYNSFTEQDEITTLLSPYRVLFSRRGWYVIGRSSLHRAVRTFNIGRIRSTEMVDSNYRIPQRFTLERYLGNAWHLIREPGKRHHVTVRFQPKVAQNVAEVQWHKTQKLKWNKDGSLDFQVTVDGLNEIQWWILGYGNQAEVIKPPQLRKMVREHVNSLTEIYASKKPKAKRSRRKKPKTA